MKKEVIINRSSDLEARPIANMVQAANSYESTVYLELNGKRVNAKSIMGMMSLALINGETVVLDAEGDDAAEALDALAVLLADSLTLIKYAFFFWS